jgi:hypothetical protein
LIPRRKHQAPSASATITGTIRKSGRDGLV